MRGGGGRDSKPNPEENGRPAGKLQALQPHLPALVYINNREITGRSTRPSARLFAISPMCE